MDATTTDVLFDGARTVRQYRDGYRYAFDALLLARFIDPLPGQTLVDFGTGSGIIPILLQYRHPTLRIWAVEIQNRLAALARDNIRENGLEHAVTVVHGDLTRPQTLGLPASLDWIIANPPFTARGSGRLNPSDEKAVARHEILMTLDQLVDSAETLLSPGGRLALIYPDSRRTELLDRLLRSGLSPCRIRPVLPAALAPPCRILVDAVCGPPRTLEEMPPLVLGKDGIE
ncbi:methyltransferase [Desulfatiferula olefinivorans]